MSTEIQKNFPIGECLYVKWRYPDKAGEWYEPFFITKKTTAFVFVDEFMGKSFRINRSALERRGFAIHHRNMVFRTEMPEEYRRQTIGYLLDSEPKKILGLADQFTSEDLKSAYRSKVMACHPDTGGNADEFMRVQAAYERLLKS